MRLQSSSINKAKNHIYLVGLIVGLILFTRQAWLSLVSLYEYKIQVPWKAIFLSLGMGVCFYLLQILSWILIMKRLKAPIGIVQALQGYTFSFLPRYIPGTIWGYWSRGQWLQKNLGISYKVSTLGSITEAVAFFITALIIVAIFGVNIVIEKSTLMVSVAALIIIIFCLLILGSVVGTALNGTSRKRKQRQQHACVPKLKIALNWLPLLLPYTVFWILYGITVAVIAQIISPLDRLATTVACAALAWVVGFIVVIIPSGLGIREMTLATLLSITIGLPPVQSNLVAVIFRMVNIFAEFVCLLIGLLVYALCRYRKEQK